MNAILASLRTRLAAALLPALAWLAAGAAALLLLLRQQAARTRAEERQHVAEDAAEAGRAAARIHGELAATDDAVLDSLLRPPAGRQHR